MHGPIDHVSLGVRDMARARAFYEPVLGTLGLRPIHILPPAMAFGDPTPVFWLAHPVNDEPATPGNGVHVCFRAPTRASVCAFHAAGLVTGGMDAGAPGPRQNYLPSYFAAYLFDPDGNKIEAVCYSLV